MLKHTGLIISFLTKINNDLCSSSIEGVKVGSVFPIQALECEFVYASKTFHKFPEIKTRLVKTGHNKRLYLLTHRYRTRKLGKIHKRSYGQLRPKILACKEARISNQY